MYTWHHAFTGISAKVFAISPIRPGKNSALLAEPYLVLRVTGPFVSSLRAFPQPHLTLPHQSYSSSKGLFLQYIFSTPSNMSKVPYSSTHAHPSHIDLPRNTDAGPATDDLIGVSVSPTTPSSTRPPPSKGILKNPLRRSSQPSDEGTSPATDAERGMFSGEQ